MHPSSLMVVLPSQRIPQFMGFSSTRNANKIDVQQECPETQIMNIYGHAKISEREYNSHLSPQNRDRLDRYIKLVPLKPPKFY